MQKPEDYNAVSILAQAFGQVGYSVDVKPIENLAESFEIYVQPIDSKPNPRPRIDLSKVSFTYDAPQKSLVAHVILWNSGQADASDVTCNIDGAIREELMTAVVMRPKEVKKAAIRADHTATVHMPFSGIEQETVDQIVKGERFLYMWGEIFNPDRENEVGHSTRFCTKYEPSTNIFATTPFFNESD